jgi:periplasmic protein CpxP/Spy
MVMKTIRVIGIVVLLVVTVSANVLADREGGGVRPGYGYGSNLDDRMIARLNLTADQKARIITLREAHSKEIQPLKNELYSRSNELKQLWLQRSLDQDRITAVEREVRTLRARIRAKMDSNQRAVSSILTPEQQAILKRYEADRKDGSGKSMRDRRGMGMAPAVDRGMRGY